ncbi:unnamed protein product, partial [Cuscuta europaea]
MRWLRARKRTSGGQNGQPIYWYPQQGQPGYAPAGGAPSFPAGSAPHAGGVPTTGTVVCNSALSHLNINALHVGVTNSSFAGLPSDGGILGSVPHPVVCQICFSAGHSAVTCPSRFTQPSSPALFTSPGESNSALWYPDSGASAHMTAPEASGAILLQASSSGPLYPLRLPSSPSVVLASVLASGPVWHRRL